MSRPGTPRAADLPRRLAGAWVYLALGVVVTLLVGWALPVLLSLRELGPQSPAARSIGDTIELAPANRAEGSGEPSLVRTRQFSADWIVATRDEAGSWPEPPFVRPGSTRDTGAPSGAVLAPAPDERFEWHSIQSFVTGLPFRAFVGESRRRSEDGLATAVDAVAIELGSGAEEPVLLPMRPLWGGLLLDVFCWSVASWFVAAFPIAVRRRRRAREDRCPACGHEIDPHLPHRPDRCPVCAAAFGRRRWPLPRTPEMHFQNTYVWIVFVSSLDIMLTWRILDRGGIEVNPIAAAVIDFWGMHGAIAFKFAVMLGVIVMCEVLARLKWSAGRFLATSAVVISASPVVWSLVLLLIHRVTAGGKLS